MIDGTRLRLALGALVGLGLGAVGVLVLPPLLVPDPETLEAKAAAILPEPGTPPLASSERTSAATEEPPASAPGAAASATAAPASAPTSAEPPASTANPVTAAAPGPARTSPKSAPSPGFDTVRMEPDGRGLVAGRAEPGAAVEVLADEQVVAQAEADEDGNFVAFLSLAPSALPRALSLRDGTGRPSEETVILAPSTAPPPPEPSPADASPSLARTAPHEAAPATPAIGNPRSEALADAGPARRDDPALGTEPAPTPDAGPALATPDASRGPATESGAEPTVIALAEPSGLSATHRPALEPGAAVAFSDPVPSPATPPLNTPAAPERASPISPDGRRPGSTQDIPAAIVPRTASSGEPEGTETASQVAGSPKEAPADATEDTEPTRLAAVEPPGDAAPGRPAAPAGVPEEGRADQPAPASPEITANAPALADPAAPALADPGAPALATDGTAPDPVSSRLLAASPDAAPQATAPPTVAMAAPPLDAPEAPQPPGQAPVLLSDADGVRVLQPALPSGADPEVLATIALDAIAYDGAGEVVLSGRANGGTVRLYLDNRPVGEAAIGPDGQWSVPLPEARPGAVHILRLDQVDAGGQVLSRIETPFRREERTALEAAMAESREPGRTVALRVVQPGNTLWAIARDRYGEPMMYVQVFEANRDRIRDPDLIYPGQLFVLPVAEER